MEVCRCRSFFDRPTTGMVEVATHLCHRSRPGRLHCECPENPRPDSAVLHDTRPLLIALTALLLTVPSALDAQVRRGRQVEEAPRWAPVAIGAKIGWDSRANGEILGAHVRVPVVRSGTFELYPSVEAVFLPGTKEYQYNLDAAWVPGGARGGVFAGGGLGWRDSVIGSDLGDPRQTFFGFNAFGGGKTNLGRVQVEFVLRWTFLNDTSYQPNSAAIGINLPLWRVGPRD